MKGERRRIWNGLIFAVLFAIVASISGGGVSAATTHYVNPGESIQAAVTAADPGGTVIVRDGTYTENVEVNVANLTLRSENGSASTTVVAALNSSAVFLITANSVTIMGFTVRNANDSASGIHLYSVHHCTVSGNNASGNYNGIYLESSSNNNLTGNTANSNYEGGIVLDYSSNDNTLTGNTANSNYDVGIYLGSSSNDNTLTGNTANSNYDVGIRLSYSSNNNTLTGNTVSNNTNGIRLDSSSNNTLTGNTASNNSYAGIYLDSSINNTLTGNTANSNYEGGIVLDYSSNDNTLMGNTANSNYDVGIYLGSSSNDNTLMGNTASNNSHGILLWSSSNNNLTGNTASDNDDGIYLYLADNNNLTGNTASDNYYGIYLESSSTNRIYNNYFNNIQNAYDNGNNVWNITKTEGKNIIGGPYLGGNYWSDYNGNDTNSDWFGDTPYDISGGTNKDYLPLVAIAAPHIFDTGKGGYPSISGIYNGTITITPFYDINVSKLYTYPCPGTGGHTEYVKIWNSTWNVTATWDGYGADWHNLTFNNSFTLYANETYNYTIVTGSYPQIIHEQSHNAIGGIITCTDLVNINGKRHEAWIPAIRLE
jgi:parallel beta-helix repeat protein